MGSGDGPLAGVRVVELAGLAPVPFAGMMLADLGADVVRVDRVGDGYAAPPGPLDRGKRRVEIDLKSPGGVEVLRRIVDAADVLIEGYRPGVAERLHIGPADLMHSNPRLVYARLTGFGQDGPLAARAGHDINYIALSGALDIVGMAGERPIPAANLLADFAGGGMLAACGILAALLEVRISGTGQVIDAAMVDGSSLLLAFIHGLHADGIWNGPRGANMLDGGAAYYGTYETSDGKYVAVGAVEPEFFSTLCAVLEIDDVDFDFQLDPNSWPQWQDALAARFRSRTRDEWAAAFAETDACVTPVLSPWEAPDHPHNRARGSFISIGGVVQPAPAPRFSKTPDRRPQPLRKSGTTDLLRSWAGGE